MKCKTAVSIYVFSFLEVGNKLRELEKEGIDWIHVDIMDGNFVNNYALCQKFCEDIKREFPKMLIDAHLMCLEPQRYIESFANSQTDNFNFHYESVTNKDEENLLKIINHIKKNGMRAVIAINPETNPEVLKPILNVLDGVMCMTIKPGFNGQKLNNMVYSNLKWLSDFKKENNLNYFIQVDGGVREDTYIELKKSGAEVLVVGAFVNVEKENLKKQINKIEGGM